VKSAKHVIPILVALTLAVMLGGCSKNTTPTGLDSTPSPAPAPAPAADPVPTLDQAPPAVPAHLNAEVDLSAGSAVLEWTASSSANAASYEVYQYSPSPKSENSYVLVGQTDVATTTYTVPWTSQQTTRYYRLRTVSSAGVKSELSDLIGIHGAIITTPPPPSGGPAPGEPSEPGAGLKTKP
jgi:hypothetical protein